MACWIQALALVPLRTHHPTPALLFRHIVCWLIGKKPAPLYSAQESSSQGNMTLFEWIQFTLNANGTSPLAAEAEVCILSSLIKTVQLF